VWRSRSTWPSLKRTRRSPGGGAKRTCRGGSNGVDTNQLPPSPGGRWDDLRGGMEWLPNRECLAVFLRGDLPRVRAAGEMAPRTMGGARGGGNAAGVPAAPPCGAHGYVADIRPWCAMPPAMSFRCAWWGNQIKDPGRLAMGKAVVSTSVGCEGLASEAVGTFSSGRSSRLPEAVCAVLQDGRLRAAAGSGRAAHRRATLQLGGDRRVAPRPVRRRSTLGRGFRTLHGRRRSDGPTTRCEPLRRTSQE